MPDNLNQPTLGAHGGKRIKGQRSDNVTLRSRGNSIVYFIARLRREGRDDLVEAIHARRISAFAVAVELGWQRRRRTVAVYGQDSDRSHRSAVIDVRSLIA